MGRQSSSQWDFGGELFPAETIRHVLTVGEITAQIRRLLEKQIGRAWVSGEVSNLRAQSSGHIYFTLKDANAQLSCVLFRGDAIGQREFLQDGQKVLLQGEITVYEPRGQYQLRVVAIELQGVGALQAAFEKLKQKLNAEGLFAPERKRALPRFPETIGLVTSPTGAAIRDVLHVIQRRNPALKIILVPCRVQGQGAADEIARAIQRLNQFAIRSPDVAPELILVTRGGGSLEDLWAFNEEVVARAIFESELPVVSGVGHEIDFTISDFAADLRAATPSAAAEIITEGIFSSCRFVSEIGQWLPVRARELFQRKQNSLQEISRRLVRAHPKRRVNDQLQRLDDLQTSLLRCVKHDWRKQQLACELLSRRLLRLRPRQLLLQRKEMFIALRQELSAQMRWQVEAAKNRLTHLETRLRLLSPEQTLARGYSITMDAATGKVVRSFDEVRRGQKLKTRLVNGEIKSTVD